MAVTKKDVDDAKQDAKNKRDQENMERELYGYPIDESGKKIGKSRPIGKVTQTTEFAKTPKKDSEPSAERTNPMGDTYKKGGTASSRADGVAQRGKTRGKMY